MAQKSRPQTDFEQRLHISLDLSPEEEDDLKKLRAKYEIMFAFVRFLYLKDCSLF